jgi:O-antigen/teichoic acid export membrane protein
MKKDKTIVRDGIYTLISNYFSQFCNIFRSFYSASLLGPVGYGIWSVVQFYINFGKYASLGVNDAAEREITQNLLNERRQENFYIIRFYLLFIISLAVLFLALGSTIFYFFNFEINFHKITIVFFTFALVAWLFERFSFVILNAYGKFKYSAIQKAMFSLVSLIMVFFLVRNYKVIGMYWAYFLALSVPVVVVFFIFSKTIFSNIKHVFFAKKPELGFKRKLISSSVLLNFVTLSSAIVFYLERFFVSYLCSNYENGIYFMAANISYSLTLAVFSFTIVIYQRINLNFGQDKNIKNTFLKVVEASKKAAVYYPIFIIVAFFFVPCFFHLFFIKYIPSIYYLKWLSVAGFFYSIFLLFNYQLVAIKKQKPLFLRYLIGMFLGSILYFSILKNYNLKLIPFAVILFNMLMFLNNFFMSSSCSGFKNIFDNLKLFIKFLIPPTFVISLALILNSVNVVSDLAFSYGIKGFIVLLIYLSILFIARKFKVLKI